MANSPTPETREQSGYRISPAQERLWAATERFGVDVRRHLVSTVSVLVPDMADQQTGGGVSEDIADVFQRAADRVIGRYEILRSVYNTHGGRRFPLQVPGEAGDRTTVTSHSNDGIEDPTWSRPRLSICVRRADPVDDANTASREDILTLSAPVFIADPHTLLLVASEIMESVRGGSPAVTDDDILQYAQYAEWSRQFVDEPEEEATEFWRGQPSTVGTPGLLTPRVVVGNPDPTTLPVGGTFPDDVLCVAERLGLSPRVAPVVLWGAFLQKVGRGDGVRFWCDFDGREIEELAGVVGPVSQELPVTLAPLSESGKSVSIDAYLGELARSIEEIGRYASEAPVDLVTIVGSGVMPEVGVELIDMSGFTDLRVVAARSSSLPHGAKLSVLLREGVGTRVNVSAAFLFDQTRLDPSSAETIVAMFRSFVAAIASNGDITFEELSSEVHPVSDNHPVLAHVESVEQSVKSDSYDLLERIERLLVEEPDAPVILFGDREYTRFELDLRASDIATALAAHGISPGDIIPLILHRSFEAVAGVIGILKVGGTFLPIDPGLPQERIDFMIGESGASIVLHDDQGRFGRMTSCEGRRIIPILVDDIPTRDTRSDGVRVSPETPAYVLFTSGSTGRPKGCVIRRRNISSYVEWATTYYLRESGATGTWPLFTSLSFDLTLTSLFVSIAGGGLLRIFPDESDIGDTLRDIFSPTSSIDIVKMTPAHVALLGETPLRETRVRGVILGGEQLRIPHVDILRGLNRDIAIFNEYGPTETTIGCTVATISPEERISIGRPIDGTRIYILDPEGREVPPYIAGEIWIAGEGTGAGYLNREDITSERFRSDLPVTGGGRAYRSGDLAWRYPDGTIVYVGRNDDQVKLRGYRVEPGEIRNRILAIDQVADAVVLPYESPTGEMELAAWYVAASEPVGTERESGEAIRAILAGQLPDYMVPLYIRRLDEIPLTVNGKLDSSRLPDPSRSVEETLSRLPESQTELELSRLWSELLGVENIGVSDDFFRLGGHSLIAMRMIARINLESGISLKIGSLFDNPTIESFASLIDRSERGTDGGVQPTRRTGGVELSDAQRRLWVLEQMEDLGPTYHIYGAYDLRGALDLVAFAEAFTALVRRHSSLRTTFPVREGRPVQEVIQIDRFDPDVIDLQSLPHSERENRAAEIARDVLEGAFELERELPIRAAVLRVDDRHHRLLVSMHHLVSDGWSVNIMVRELGELYDAFVSGRSPVLPELSLDYADFVDHQKRELSSGRGEELRAYWLNQLEGASPLDLPSDLPRSGARSYLGENVRLSVGQDRLRRLELVGQEHGASLFMVLVALLDTLFHRYSGEEDITIGTAIAGRDCPELAAQIGFYVNLLPLRVRLDGEMTFGRLLREVRSVALGAFDHQSYPFDRLVDELGVEREVGRSPLFDTFIVLQDPDTDRLRFGGVELSEYPYENRSNAYDLAFNFEPIDGQLECTISFSTDLYARERIERLVDHLHSLIDAVTDDRGDEQPISSLPLFPRAEVRERVERWSRDDTFDGRRDQGILEQIEHHSRTMPDAEAIWSNRRTLSYGELNRRSNGIAMMLADLIAGRGVDTSVGVPIVVLLPRCVELPLLFVSIRKAGGIYVPIDVDFPRDRIERMLRECGAEIIISDRNGSRLIEEGEAGRTIINLDELHGLGSDVAPAVDRSPDDVVAIFFTSGSTGVPKGVPMYERGLNNAAWSKVSEVSRFADEIRALSFASPSFDASLIMMLVPLVAGGTVVVFDRETIERTENFLAAMEEGGVTFAILPPTYLATIDGADFPTLRVLSTAGEPPVISDVRHYAERIPYINAYGPAECSICVSMYMVDPSRDFTTGVPIGREIPNTIAMVVDWYGNVLPEGIDGELWVGGTGIGPGYLRREDTERAFVEHDAFPGIRFYRTGDIVRRGFDGLLHFRGRRDNQVKIRGHRVEPGETALALGAHPAISDAAVVTYRDDGGALTLVAWIVPSVDPLRQSIDLFEIRTWLSERLPSYMIPSRYFITECLPLGPTGKVDDARLREMTVTEITSSPVTVSTTQPESEEERILCRAVADVLGLESVTPDDNYFMLGGDSIRAIELTWRLRSQGYRIEVRDLFSRPVLADAARSMVPEQSGSEDSRVVGPVPLHPIQHWFFESTSSGSAHHFNQSTLIRWTDGRIDVAKLRTSLAYVMDRHDMLRACYVDAESASRSQIVAPEMSIDLSEVEVQTDDGADERFIGELRATHRDFRLETGPLFRTKVIRRREEREVVEYVQFVAHHLVIDIVSWHILLDDLFGRYRAEDSAGQVPVELVPTSRGSSYRAWVEAIERFIGSEAGSAVIDYWRTIGTRLTDSRPLPVRTDVPRRTGHATTLTVNLTPDISSRLIGEVHTVFNTDVRDILVAALGRTLIQATGGPRVGIGLEGHGRDVDQLRDLDVGRTVGWFTSVYPVLLERESAGRGDLNGVEHDPAWSIKQAKESIRSLPMNGAGYGAVRYLLPEEQRIGDLIGTHVQVMLNYVGVEGGRPGGGLFEICEEEGMAAYHPDLTAPTEIQILASIIGGELRASLTYVPGRVDTDLVEGLANAWMNEIESLVGYLLGRSESELTPSDVDYAGLSIDDLDDILAKITTDGE